MGGFTVNVAGEPDGLVWGFSVYIPLGHVRKFLLSGGVFLQPKEAGDLAG
jgi:hypothetical protein